MERAVQDSLHTIVGDRVVKEESGFAVISEAVGDLTDNLQHLIIHQRDTLTKVQQDNERMAAPIMQMIGSIQFQDVVKRRLQGLVQAFDHMANSIEEVVGQVSQRPDISLEEMNAIIRGNLDRMVNVGIEDLKAGRFADVGQKDGSPPQGAAIELF
ncbi:MAG: hypothetical protein H7Y60_15720 [Rhodospirillaceae bacterium]|nr:hypothetical protein [Rhodospirillales bacterium]